MVSLCPQFFTRVDLWCVPVASLCLFPVFGLLSELPTPGPGALSVPCRASTLTGLSRAAAWVQSERKVCVILAKKRKKEWNSLNPVATCGLVDYVHFGGWWWWCWIVNACKTTTNTLPPSFNLNYLITLCCHSYIWNNNKKNKSSFLFKHHRITLHPVNTIKLLTL